MLKISSSLSRKAIRQLFSRENILRIFDLSKIAVRVCYLSRYLPCILFSLRVHYSCIFFSSLLKRGQLTHVHEIVSPRGINWIGYRELLVVETLSNCIICT